MRTFIIVFIFCFPSFCWAQVAPARLALLGIPSQGRLAALTSQASSGGLLVGVVEDDLVVSRDRGRTWQVTGSIEQIEPDPEDVVELEIAPLIASDGEVTIVVVGSELLVSRDPGRSFVQGRLPLEEVRAVALVDSGATLLVATAEGVVRFRLAPRGAVFVEVLALNVVPNLLAAGPGLVAAASGGYLFVSHDGGRSFQGCPTALPGDQEVLALAVDGSGELWVATTAGLMVLDEASRLRSVVARTLSPGEVSLVRGPEGEMLVLERGELWEVRFDRARPARGFDLPPERLVRTRGRGRRPVRGVLPSFSLDLIMGPETTAISLDLVWPFPPTSTADLVEARRLELARAEERRESEERQIDAWQRWATASSALSGQCPSGTGGDVLEQALEAVGARAELELETTTVP